MDLCLKGKSIFVSGSTGGIGSVIVKYFLNEGAEVIVHGRDKAKLEKQLSALTKKYPGRISSIKADLTDQKDRSHLLNEITKKFDTLNVAIFCVGNGNVKKGYDLDQNEWDKIFAQNFFATGLLRIV